MLKDAQMAGGDTGKVKQQDFKVLNNEIARVMSKTCSEFCQSGGYGDGVVIGKAWFCGASCEKDCTTHCVRAVPYWSDYGKKCWTGNKVCCCGEFITILCEIESLMQYQLQNQNLVGPKKCVVLLNTQNAF